MDAGAGDVAVDSEVPDPRPLLEVIIRGVGGQVVSSPPGIQCTSSCGARFDPGTAVTLTAQPEAGYWFGGWLKDCAGRGSCAVTMDRDHAVSASFFLANPPWDSSVGAGDCQDVWTAQAQRMSPCDQTPDDYVVVNKSKRNLALCDRGACTQSFQIGLGFAPVGDKVQQGDGKTPEGTFYVSALVPDSSFYKAFLISYPDKEDAARGLSMGLITAEEKAAIDAAQEACGAPPSSTDVGGEIGIHGGGGGPGDWTAGCVAVSNGEMDALWGVLAPRDTVVILP